MRKKIVLVSIGLILIGGCSGNYAGFFGKKEPADYVDPLLGTSSARWMLYPGPSMPFSMVKLSPDNEDAKQKLGGAGYEYNIDTIAGFSHIHSWTMGGLLMMPTTGELKTKHGGKNPDEGYRSRFSHDTEVAEVGYYAVTLADYGIRAELTSTMRAGFQRYTFPKADEARILFDFAIPIEYYYGGFEIEDAYVRKVSDTEIEGYAKHGGVANAGRGIKPMQEYTLHFVAKFSKPFESLGGWTGKKIYQNVIEFTGKGDVGVFVNYSTGENEVIKVKTGISLVSIEGARLNLEMEMDRFAWNFEAVRNHHRLES